MEVYLAIVLAIVVVLFTIAFYLQEKKFKELEKYHDERCLKFDKATENYWAEHARTEKEIREQKQEYWVTINELEFENKKLKAIIDKHEKQENVPRETSYNQSFGMPEVTDYYDQQYAREDTRRG